MTWWQFLLAAWAIGAVAAFPCNWEFMASDWKDQEQSLTPGRALRAALVGALFWPVAWVALFAIAFRGDAR